MESTEICVKSITSCLKSAAEKSIPSKTIKFKGPKKPVSREVLSCLKTVKKHISFGIMQANCDQDSYLLGQIGQTCITQSTAFRGSSKTEIIL